MPSKPLAVIGAGIIGLAVAEYVCDELFKNHN